MYCEHMHVLLGPYVDGELSPEARSAIDAHLRVCESCRHEVGQLREFESQIKIGGTDCEPPALWNRIANQLNVAGDIRPAGHASHMRSILAIAACLFMAVGGGYFAVNRGLDGASKAEAAPVNFSVLLDGLTLDAEQAFRNFVALYHGRRVSATEAERHATQLNFAIPDELPGGFGLNAAFAMRIGDAPAAAAIYRRDGEFVGTIFHRAIHPEDYGTHRDHPCVVGEHRGHRVEAGAWRLVHVTDATTCHCVLSCLDEKSELPPILDAVAPRSSHVELAPDHHHAP